MIDFYVTEQTIRFASPVIAANSRDYLTARFHFSGEAWEDCSKWAHFRQGETVYDLNLENDQISSGMHLNLSVGQWEVYLTGHRDESRITTVPVLLRVRESGLVDEPLHQIPLSVAEQVDSKANLALEKAKDIEAKLASGALDGKDFQIRGFYESLEELEAAVEKPGRGDAYGVGMEAPYDIYVYDGLNECWVNNGSIQGPKGDTGANGATFSPRVDSSGNLSWVNDKGLPNPQTVNLRGDKGDKGDKGDDGESPYALAVKEGFGGTEATFNWSLAHIAGHAAQHKAGGTDPLEVETDSIKAGAVTRSKLAADAKAVSFTNKSVAASDWVSDATYTDFPYRAAVACEGVTAKHYAEVTFSPVDALKGIFCPVTVSYDGGVYIYASEIPEAAMTIPTIVCIPVE
ncbi:MAG: hypothetical protein ACI4O0_07910 [Candidatus Limivicinus sp.]